MLEVMRCVLLCMLEVPKVMRRVLLCMLEVLEVPEVIRCVRLEDADSKDNDGSEADVTKPLNELARPSRDDG